MAEPPERQEASGEEVELELRIPEPAVKPLFANYIQSNVTKLGGGPRLTTLTFIHIFPVPIGPTESQQQGEVVTRVVLSDESVAGLRALLERQHKVVSTAGRRTKRRSRE